MSVAVESLQKQAYNHLRRELVLGKWQDGDFLNPSKLAKDTGISYTPVREAIIQLVAEGILQQVPKVGACVRTLDKEEVQELFELREILECGAAKLAINKISDELIEQLCQLCREQIQVLKKLKGMSWQDQDGKMLEQINLIDVSFHMKLIAASKNRKMIKMIGDLHILTKIFQRRVFNAVDNLPEHLTTIYIFHRRIFNALKRRDVVKLQQRLAAHIRWAGKFHLEFCDQEKKNDNYFLDDLI